MNPTITPPSELRRALWVYVALAVVISLSGPSNLLFPEWWQRQQAGDLAALSVPAVVGIALGLVFSRDIWRLVVRRNPLWKDLALGFLPVAAFVALILLRELEVWLWSFESGDTLAFSLLATMTIVTALTEQLKQVRVYAFARHFTFVRKQNAT